MDHGTPAGRAVLDPALDDPGMDDETDVRLATFLRVLSRVSRASSHDIRNPLHTMAIYVDLLKRLVEAPERERVTRQKQHIEVLESEIHNLDLMLNHFFAQMRLESKAPERLDLVKVVHEILEFLEPYRRSIHAEIAWEPPADLVGVTATKESLRHALIYLLVSALDSAAKAELRVQVMAREGRAVFVVTGPPAWSASIRGIDLGKALKESGLEVTRRSLQRERATLEVRSGASRPTILEIQMPLIAAEV